MSILDILNEIASTTSSNEKVSILMREQNNTLLKLVFRATYNPMISYYIKKIPLRSSIGGMINLRDSLKELNILSSRILTGNDAISHLSQVLGELGKDDAEVVSRIIQRDLKCGCSDILASRVWADIVPTFNVMLSHKDISGIKFPAYAQIKSDGARAHMYFDGVSATACSRNGKPIELHGVFDAEISKLIKANQTLDGELLCVKNGKILSRAEGNGIVNKAVKGTISKEEAKMLFFVVWDIVDITSTIPYSTRIDELTTSYNKNCPTNIKVLYTTVVSNEDAANDFFQVCLDAGEEGAMIKNMDSIWVPKRSKNLGKMKAEEEADLLVTGWYYGEVGKKYENSLGGLICTTSDGLIEVNCGGGFSDIERSNGNLSNWLGKIVTVRYNMRIKSKTDKKESLFLPRYVCTRFDKDLPNSSEELK